MSCLTCVDVQTIICKTRITEELSSFSANKDIVFCIGTFTG